MSGLTEEQATEKLQKLLEHNQNRFVNYVDKPFPNGPGYMQVHLTKMRNEFGSEWDEQRAAEYIASLAADEGLREI